jgi:large subunit ribosomal protein L28
MAQICEFCGKGSSSGQHIRHVHSGQWARKAPRTKRRFRPNLQTVTVRRGGRARRMRVCAKCLKSERFIKTISP